MHKPVVRLKHVQVLKSAELGLEVSNHHRDPEAPRACQRRPCKHPQATAGDKAPHPAFSGPLGAIRQAPLLSS